jgi:hypothetical protein
LPNTRRLLASSPHSSSLLTQQEIVKSLEKKQKREGSRKLPGGAKEGNKQDKQWEKNDKEQ